MARWQLALGTAFNVRPGEGQALFLLVVQSFFAGLCFVFFETAANALFFSTFDIENLPYVYIALAPVATATGVLYARCERFLTTLWLLRATLVFVLASVLLFTAAYYIAPQRWLFAVLMVWKDVLWMFPIAGLVTTRAAWFSMDRARWPSAPAAGFSWST